MTAILAAPTTLLWIDNTSRKETDMLNRTTLLAVLMLGLGTMRGYAAARKEFLGLIGSAHFADK